MSRWAKQNWDLVNKTVQRGIFEGLAKTIAAQMVQESGLAGIKGVKIAGDTVMLAFTGRRRRWPERQLQNRTTKSMSVFGRPIKRQ